ncbi:MAG TPA: hypothetical protein VIG30_12380 [Ktedonobacterales bacterium]|jgi:hypothetical protein
MGKYKQWLHHQEVGRRLRDQITNLEQERDRIQKMAPGHPTTLPDLDNPVIASLLAFTRQGHSLGQVDGPPPITGMAPGADGGFGGNNSHPTPAIAGGDNGLVDPAVVASLLARADQMPADPLDQVRALADGQAGGGGSLDQANGQPGNPDGSDSVGGWWQRYRPDDQQ